MRVGAVAARMETAVRQVHREIKWRVSAIDADALERFFESRLPVWPRFPGRRDTTIRSVYLDYADRSLTARALERPAESMKVRYKRYSPPMHPSRTSDTSVTVWLEVKFRAHRVVTKERMPYPGTLLASLLVGKLEPPRDAPALCEVLGAGPLQPVAAVRYRRTAFGGPDEPVRLTIDRDVRFQEPHRPGDRVPDVGALEGCVVEVKSENGLPPWLTDAMDDFAFSTVSKFEEAVRAIASQ